MLRLVHSGTKAPPGRGWLRAAAYMELLVGGIWTVVMVRAFLRGMVGREVDTLAAIGLLGYGMALVGAGSMLLAGRRWAWLASLPLGAACVVFGAVSKQPAAVTFGLAIVTCLVVGRQALENPGG